MPQGIQESSLATINLQGLALKLHGCSFFFSLFLPGWSMNSPILATRYTRYGVTSIGSLIIEKMSPFHQVILLILAQGWEFCHKSTWGREQSTMCLETLYPHVIIYTLGIQSPCQMMIGVHNHLLRKVFRFRYHSQKVIGSLGIYIYIYAAYMFASITYNIMCLNIFI